MMMMMAVNSSSTPLLYLKWSLTAPVYPVIMLYTGWVTSRWMKNGLICQTQRVMTGGQGTPTGGQVPVEFLHVFVLGSVLSNISI